MAGSPPGEEITRLELLHATHPDGRIFTHLAEAYRKAGDLERARETIERGLERHGSYPSAHVVHGRVL
ncbi:MAG TPA: tetratricopeptide repeat protein, partial [Longimicrobiales bacterium]